MIGRWRHGFLEHEGKLLVLVGDVFEFVGDPGELGAGFGMADQIRESAVNRDADFERSGLGLGEDEFDESVKIGFALGLVHSFTKRRRRLRMRVVSTPRRVLRAA